MAVDPEEKLALAAAQHEDAAESRETRELYLRDGRTLSVTTDGRDELVEVRASSGQLELRIKLTEQGPVLQMESVRLELKASEAVEIEAKQFAVRTEQGIALESKGEVAVRGEADVRVDAKGEVHVNGAMIYLN